jgi:AcrR family transcriptional regulator
MSRVGVGVRREALRARSRNAGAVVSARGRVAEMQRSRLLGAAVLTLEELGWSRVTVAHVTARARVSRRTFYDLFANREDCLLAVMDDALARVEDELAAANLEGLSWRERVRAGLWTILCFFDREPGLARVCVVQSARGGQRVLERREEILACLTRVLDEGRGESERAGEVPALMADGLVGAVLTIVCKRLLEPEPLGGLLGDLMGMIVLPYLGSGAARRERDRPVPPVPVWRESSPVSDGGGEGPLPDIPMRLTYRTARVLGVLAVHPGVSNRMVAEYAGIADQGQVSKLLARLQRLGLLANTGEGQARGEPNAWQLTRTGVQVASSIGTHGHTNEAAAV